MCDDHVAVLPALTFRNNRITLSVSVIVAFSIATSIDCDARGDDADDSLLMGRGDVARLIVIKTVR